jgi:hypothetical protein
MKVVAGVFMLLCWLTAGGSRAQTDLSRDTRVDWWDHALLGRHSDVISGEVALLGRGDGVVFVAVDEAAGGGERDGWIDYLFLFESDSLELRGRVLTGDAVVRYWHDGLRIRMVTSGENVELRVRGSSAPRFGRAWGDPTLVDAGGIGLIEHTGRTIQELALVDALDLLESNAWRDFALALIPPVEHPDPGGGGGSGCAKMCSIGCQYGTCMVSCGQHCALCYCRSYPSGTPFCGCS